MKVETLSEKDINAIGHAFGYYEYAQGEKGLVSAYSSKDAVVSYINGYVEMVLQAGMLYTTGPQQEAFIAYKRCDEKVGLKAGQKLIKGMFAGSSFGEVVRMLSILGSGGSSSNFEIKFLQFIYVYFYAVFISIYAGLRALHIYIRLF